MQRLQLAYLVNPNRKEYDQKVCEDANQNLPMDFQVISSIEEIFTSLSNVNFYADYLCLDLDHLKEKEAEGTNYIELLTTIKTLINCTVCRPPTFPPHYKPLRRNIKVIVIVNEDDDPTEIRSVSKIVDGLAPRVGKKWTHSMVQDYIKDHLITKDMSIPKIIQDYLKNSGKVLKLTTKRMILY